MPKKFKNVSPLGALEIPALGIVVEPGEIFTVSDALAPNFADQADTFKPVGRATSVAPTGEDDGSVVPSSSDTEDE